MRPPMEIWLDDEAISDHFDNVRDRIKAGNVGSGAEESWESIPDQNELTRDIKKR